MSIAAKIDRFVRWFFNVSPTETEIEPQSPRRRAAGSPRRARAASPKERRDARPERREKRIHRAGAIASAMTPTTVRKERA
jgi:hypothetical protein